MSHIVEDRRKQKIPEFILTEWRMSLDCLEKTLVTAWDYIPDIFGYRGENF